MDDDKDQKKLDALRLTYYYTTVALLEFVADDTLNDDDLSKYNSLLEMSSKLREMVVDLTYGAVRKSLTEKPQSPSDNRQ